MTAQVISIVTGMIAGAAVGTAGGERIRLGDDHFSVEIETPLTGWIAGRGPRFDTTAAVVSVRLEGQEFLSAGGLSDEFNPKWISPPGYDQAVPGEPFLKIGVGVPLRKSAWRYFFETPYAVKRLAEVERVASGAAGAGVAFHQQCDSGPEWSYDYTKNYAMDIARRQLTVRYRLRNTGTRVFVIEQYNHNWFRHDDGKVSDVRLDAPFILADGLEIVASSPMPVYRMGEQSLPAERNRARLYRLPGGRRVEFSGDFDVSRFALFADAQAYCPEVFLKRTLKSGEETEWSRTYSFGIEP